LTPEPVDKPDLERKYAAHEAAPVRDPRFWEVRYEARDTGWDLGAPAPPLVEYFESGRAPKPPQRVLVPGCGRGNDALYLAKLGYDVVAVDFAKQAVDAVRRRRRDQWIPAERCRTLRADVLRLPARLAGAFDIVVEHTCFCAIDPSGRDDYARMAAAVLVPGGSFVGLLYPFRAESPGPPFPVSEEEVQNRFAEDFEILTIETPVNSIERRRGEERLVVMRRR
jgi:SAM-dependent methyltransferase